MPGLRSAMRQLLLILSLLWESSRDCDPASWLHTPSATISKALRQVWKNMKPSWQESLKNICARERTTTARNDDGRTHLSGSVATIKSRSTPDRYFA